MENLNPRGRSGLHGSRGWPLLHSTEEVSEVNPQLVGLKGGRGIPAENSQSVMDQGTRKNHPSRSTRKKGRKCAYSSDENPEDSSSTCSSSSIQLRIKAQRDAEFDATWVSPMLIARRMNDSIRRDLGLPPLQRQRDTVICLPPGSPRQNCASQFEPIILADL